MRILAMCGFIKFKMQAENQT